MDCASDDSCTFLAPYPSARELLRGFCAHYDVQALGLLRERLGRTAEWVCSFKHHQAGPSMELASELCARAVLLLEQHSRLPAHHRPLAVGAVRYLLFRVDVIPDRRGREGLEDDRAVVNHVLQRLGLNQHLLPHTIAETTPPRSTAEATPPRSPEHAMRKLRWKKIKARRARE